MTKAWFSVLLVAGLATSAVAFAPQRRAPFRTRAVPVAMFDQPMPIAEPSAALLQTATVQTAAPAQSVIQMAPLSLAKTEIRQGIYKDYEIDVQDQQVDDARSTFKSAANTKKGKNKYVAVLGVLLIGSFIIPMLQYFWYVRED